MNEKKSPNLNGTLFYFLFAALNGVIVWAIRQLPTDDFNIALLLGFGTYVGLATCAVAMFYTQQGKKNGKWLAATLTLVAFLLNGFLTLLSALLVLVFNFRLTGFTILSVLLIVVYPFFTGMIAQQWRNNHPKEVKSASNKLSAWAVILIGLMTAIVVFLLNKAMFSLFYSTHYSDLWKLVFAALWYGLIIGVLGGIKNYQNEKISPFVIGSLAIFALCAVIAAFAYRANYTFPLLYWWVTVNPGMLYLPLAAAVVIAKAVKKSKDEPDTSPRRKFDYAKAVGIINVLAIAIGSLLMLSLFEKFGVAVNFLVVLWNIIVLCAIVYIYWRANKIFSAVGLMLFGTGLIGAFVLLGMLFSMSHYSDHAVAVALMIPSIAIFSIIFGLTIAHLYSKRDEVKDEEEDVEKEESKEEESPERSQGGF